MACREDEFEYQSAIQLETKRITESKKISVVKPLSDAIKLKSSDPEMQVRIATSIVQQIPFACQRSAQHAATNFSSLNSHFSSPYEVLYDRNGVCGEKSMLLAILIGDLGFGSAYIRFSDIHHGVAGIKGRGNDQYLNTSYILLETTNPDPLGCSSVIEGLHFNNVSYPLVIPVSQGTEFYLTDQDRIDKQNYLRLGMMKQAGIVYSNEEQHQADDLINRYGSYSGCS